MTLVDEPATVVRSEPPSAEGPPNRGWHTWQVDVGRTFIVVALLVAWVFAYLAIFSGFQAGHRQHELYDQFRTELALAEAPVGAPIKSGDPVALISIPRVGMKNLIVVEGTGSSELQSGPGHLRGTVLPGQAGASVLLGRALSFGGPFGSLDKLRVGDPITVTTGQGTFEYKVTGARHQGDPEPAAPAASGKEGRLTLVTAIGSGPFAKLAPSDAVYFDATTTTAVGPGRISESVDTEQPMVSNVRAGTLAELALALQLLLAALFAASWARVRWSTAAAWIVGTPTVLAALWLVSALASRLIPNLV